MALSERLIIMIETRLIYVNCLNDGVDKIYQIIIMTVEAGVANLAAS